MQKSAQAAEKKMVKLKESAETRNPVIKEIGSSIVADYDQR
jgi:hypothetical protein